MKKLVLAFSVLCSFLLQAQAAENGKDVEPTLQVTKAFEKDFPKVKPFWRKEFDGDDADKLSYEADFTVSNTNMTAVYNALGVFKVLEVQIKESEIPKKISTYMARNYPKNTIKKAARLMTNSNKITYEIGITINEKWVDAIFNKEGDFLEMVEKD
ncbi:hypothetical protein [Flavobacterium wongokense]|uniref:hypothetical protein n=1 Tax=Flavobacterium wongokense TaxID=2910674 RepID=UPI001F330613|nr:hypothetical protein [Flavobacterium sp. WG47]MCF6131621.1 hypothetical protein [Flavobacterium sp. WG47]